MRRPFIVILLGPQQCGMPLSDGRGRNGILSTGLAEFACCSPYISSPTVQRPQLTVRPGRQPGDRDRSSETLGCSRARPVRPGFAQLPATASVSLLATSFWFRQSLGLTDSA